MNMQDWCKKEGIPLTKEQVGAAEFLDVAGFIFCGNYGYENCVAIAELEKDRILRVDAARQSNPRMWGAA